MPLKWISIRLKTIIIGLVKGIGIWNMSKL